MNQSRLKISHQEKGCLSWPYCPTFGVMKYIIICFILCVAIAAISGCSQKAPDNIGLKNGELAPCPESDNCVSSQATDEKHSIAPIKAHGATDVVMVDLSAAIENMFGGKIITIKENYLHAEFTSKVFRFVDDLECFYDVKAGLIQVRSASRIGYSDLSANRKRVEELRKLFTVMQ